jgi:ABC-type transport system substrate-binding protein
MKTSKRIFVFLITLITVTSFVACSDTATSVPTATAVPADIPTAAATDTLTLTPTLVPPTDTPAPTMAPTEAVDSTTVSEAFQQLFLYLYELDSGLNYGTKYIAVDPTNVPEPIAELLIPVIRKLTDENGWEFLIDTYEGLVEKGYVDESQGNYFVEGLLFRFENIKISDNALEVDASKFRSGLGAIGGTYTVSLDGLWRIESSKNWIS